MLKVISICLLLYYFAYYNEVVVQFRFRVSLALRIPIILSLVEGTSLAPL